MKTVGDLIRNLERSDPRTPLGFEVEEENKGITGAKAAIVHENQKDGVRIRIKVPSFTRQISFKVGVDLVSLRPGTMVFIKAGPLISVEEMVRAIGESLDGSGVRAVVLPEGAEVQSLSEEDFSLMGYVPKGKSLEETDVDMSAIDKKWED